MPDEQQESSPRHAVARAFQPAGSGDILVPSFYGPSPTSNRTV